MGTDVDRIVLGFRSIHEVWASLLEMILAIYILERQLQAACIMPGLLTLGKLHSHLVLDSGTWLTTA